ncbi:monooxygenase asqM [Colletotrichum spaethianum]|uniref:Monooxygenase asqM n=1 Tax=Colletotrichum spaethianum TaxID=700344 RepID=A0AA37P8M5_9PEZI|nr:monooxygenase asqM [Colletotrichum spaethianum]GKT47668.1 monooxygenase asqM [Colletotrichum spaethianum]
MTHTQTRFATTPIAIIGAGPCGLTFARLLENENIDYVVFERDANSNPTLMHQGGTLDLHANSGQQAIKKAGLFEEFRKLARWDATRFVIQNPECTLKATFGEGRDAPEIDRFQLRQLLLDSIPSHKVQWGHGVRNIERNLSCKSKAPELTINFTNGTSASGFLLVVGADGAWSKVRPLLTSAKPEYSGKIFIEGRISHGNPSYEAALELSGPGNMMALGHGRALGVQQVADRSYRVYMGLEAPETLTRTALNMDDTKATKEKLLSSTEFFKDFAPDLRRFIADAEGPFRPWPLYRMPVSSLCWARVPGVTLLGDAAHVSTPFVGEGVNMAMHDALKLAQSLLKHCKSLKDDNHKDVDEIEQALAEYEAEMFGRAQDFINRCMLSEEMFFADNAAQKFIDLVTDATNRQQEQLFSGSSSSPQGQTEQPGTQSAQYSKI